MDYAYLFSYLILYPHSMCILLLYDPPYVLCVFFILSYFISADYMFFFRI